MIIPRRVVDSKETLNEVLEIARRKYGITDKTKLFVLGPATRTVTLDGSKKIADIEIDESGYGIGYYAEQDTLFFNGPPLSKPGLVKADRVEGDL